MGYAEFRKREKLVFLASIALMLLSLPGCSSGVAGEYECKEIDATLHVDADGTFTIVRGYEIKEGTWAREGDRVVFNVPTFLGTVKWEMTVSGNDMIDEEGKLWKKNTVWLGGGFLLLIIVIVLTACITIFALAVKRYKNGVLSMKTAFPAAGVKLQQGSGFCRYCGAMLSNPTANYCSRCGRKLHNAHE